MLPEFTRRANLCIFSPIVRISLSISVKLIRGSKKRAKFNTIIEFSFAVTEHSALLHHVEKLVSAKLLNPLNLVNLFSILISNFKNTSFFRGVKKY
jgi:hypothetical protein